MTNLRTKMTVRTRSKS